MKEEDLTIFDYRKQKEILFSDVVQAERLRNDYVRMSVYTPSCGWIDYSIYHPLNRSAGDLPAVFVFHGGGFVLGYAEQEGRYCRQLADATGCAIVNVDYALAPEFKFPLPIRSAYEALCSIMVNAETLGLDRERIIVMGHSSGGAIAADLCLIDRDEGKLGIKGQILACAPLDQELDQSHRTIANPDGSVSESRALQYIHWFFANEADVDNPLASPARCADVHGLPRMLVIEAEEDSLSDEEMSYAERCRKAGVDVSEHLFKGCGHGFTHECFGNYKPNQAHEAWNLMADFIKETANK